jgi:hypothetical protein
MLSHKRDRDPRAQHFGVLARLVGERSDYDLKRVP